MNETWTKDTKTDDDLNKGKEEGNKIVLYLFKVLASKTQVFGMLKLSIYETRY